MTKSLRPQAFLITCGGNVMGLDMYAFAEKELTKIEQTEELIKNGEINKDEIELMYWRKHNALHGWMEQLYRQKGGKDEFNCVRVYLDTDDLLQLENDIKNKGLKSVEGFFFGNNYDYNSEELEGIRKDDKTFIEEARKHINMGYTIYYTSWW